MLLKTKNVREGREKAIGTTHECSVNLLDPSKFDNSVFLQELTQIFHLSDVWISTFSLCAYLNQKSLLGIFLRFTLLCDALTLPF